jgi:hypothetical protein
MKNHTIQQTLRRDGKEIFMLFGVSVLPDKGVMKRSGRKIETRRSACEMWNLK